MSTKEIVKNKENLEENQLVKSEVEDYAKFDILRYAQVWEDADILLQALDIHEDDNILSIASAGENAKPPPLWQMPRQIQGFWEAFVLFAWSRKRPVFRRKVRRWSRRCAPHPKECGWRK